MKISGSVALVTGGASGLGEATVRQLVSQGGRAVIVDRNADYGEQLAAELGDAATFARADVSNADEVQALFAGRPLLAMISGHWHGNTEKIENGILMTTTACSSSTRGNHDGTKPKGYRVFTIHPDRTVSTEFKEVKA